MHDERETELIALRKRLADMHEKLELARRDLEVAHGRLRPGLVQTTFLAGPYAGPDVSRTRAVQVAFLIDLDHAERIHGSVERAFDLMLQETKSRFLDGLADGRFELPDHTPRRKPYLPG